MDQTLKTSRKQFFDDMERNLREGHSPEDSLFYLHPSEDHIVLSHALFWVMTQSFKGKSPGKSFSS